MVRGYLTHFQQLSSNVKFFLIGNAVQGLGLSIYSLLFNLYLKELGFGESSIGSLISTASLGISLMAIPAALFIERFHVKHLVMTGMLFSSFFYFIQILNVGESGLFTFGLLASMFQAIFNISVSPFYLRNSTPQVRVYVYTLNSAMNMGAHLVGYLIGGFLPELLKEISPLSSQIEIFRSSIMIALSLVFMSNLLFIQIKRVPIPRNHRHLFEGLKGKEWRILSRLIIPKLCFSFGGGLVVPFMNLYLKERFNLSTQMIGISYAILQTFIFVGIFISPALIKRTTRLNFIMITGFLAVPFMITMGLATSVTIVLSCFFIRGMLMNMSSPIISMFEMEHVNEKDCVFASAMIQFFHHLVYTTSTRIGGLMIEKFSFGPTFYMAGAFYFAAVVCYYYFFRHENAAEIRFLKESRVIDVEAA